MIWGQFLRFAIVMSARWRCFEYVFMVFVYFKCIFWYLLLYLFKGLSYVALSVNDD